MSNTNYHSKKGVEQALNLPTIEQLQEMLNLTPVEPDSLDELALRAEEVEKTSQVSLEEAKAAMKKLKDLRVQLKDLPDVTHRKSHLDRLATIAEEKFNDIFDRAMNCEDKFMTSMIDAATHMMKVAVDAHTRILEADIKLVDLQIKKDKIEWEFNQLPKPIKQHEEKSVTGAPEDDVPVATVNRNALLSGHVQNK